MSVGVRELKNKLSHYLRMVKRGEKLAVTERGKTIAYLIPARKSAIFEEVTGLVSGDRAFWKGGKPSGARRPAQTKGRPVSQIVIEERR